MSKIPPWPELQPILRFLVNGIHRTTAEIAEEIGISRPGLQNLVSGESKEPYPRTQRSVWRWITTRTDGEFLDDSTRDEFHRLFPRIAEEWRTRQEQRVDRAAEQELLDYFLEHHAQMAAFMTLQAEELDAEDRRKVYFAGLNALKRAYIRAGEPIPDALFDLERRLLAEG